MYGHGVWLHADCLAYVTAAASLLETYRRSHTPGFAHAFPKTREVHSLPGGPHSISEFLAFLVVRLNPSIRCWRRRRIWDVARAGCHVKGTRPPSASLFFSIRQRYRVLFNVTFFRFSVPVAFVFSAALLPQCACSQHGGTRGTCAASSPSP